MQTKLYALGWLLSISLLAAAESKKITVLRTPNGGIQPQAAVDAVGVVHLIYYKGDAGGGDVFYVRREANAGNFSQPIPVNNQPGSAIAAGTIRGAQLALGKGGRVHVVWNGGKGAKKVAVAGKEVTPLLYTRLNDAGTAFEPERNLITQNAGLDGGSAVAADSQGNVYVFWHGSAPDNTTKEAGRAVFVSRSRDDGKTFAPETRATDQETGACGCCGMKALADAQGAVYVLYRAATENTERGETLLMSRKPGAPFEVAFSDPWKATTCPMSSASLTVALTGALAAWETGNQVKFGAIDPATLRVSTPVAQVAAGKRKHPVAVSNKSGETLFVWTEGTAWAKGGSVAWQLYHKDGTTASDRGRVEGGVAVWSLPTAVALPDDGFLIVH
ncbi:MAG TPA: hypothetical protein VGF13_13685 [Verrucomicrobiae bacterium]